VRRGIAILFLIITLSSCGLLTDPEEQCGGFRTGAASLDGRLYYADGRGVAHAAITLGMNRQTETDADGSFSFRDLTAGTYPLRSVDSPYLLRGDIQVTRGRNVVRIIVPNQSFSGWAAGRVLDACTGRPIAGARIGWPDHYIETDGNGTYVRGACCNSEFGVMIWKDGYIAQPFSGSRISAATLLHDYELTRQH
jgi:hypothetical protein